ncbi:NAD-dependent succinate-semialdehyde dehydrogenase [Kordiimonas lacus]|uniref:Aspartate-semialdehyde dehydrogenase n=1 Tax=Kordiimonas lacus TaxID=637679 RepID=A0A1G7FDC3_9PROT|nr:NAD-dependent succinate-semialdehyde dehydrogenase [Kordiimonas lacus]SDE73826.1 aspartate-semialdehyde dehydrogenase [Kordiimonas lacus]
MTNTPHILQHLRNAALLDHPLFAPPQEGLDVTDPATGVTLGTVANKTADDTVQAINHADTSLAAWQELGTYKRADILHRWADLMAENRNDLATIITLEQGKPFSESKGEIDYALSFLHWFAEEGKRHYGETIPSHKDGARLLTLRQPIGVTAAITPWNFPSAMITRKAGAALAAGCSMIVRPATETPFSAIALQVLAEQAGIPAGVFQTLTGDPEPIVGMLTKSDTVRALSFTGSTAIGKMLARQSMDTLKKISMELGGHAPFIVLPDADLDTAVDGVMAAKFATSGQDCLAVNKCYVPDNLYDAFCEKVTVRVAALKVGNGMERGIDIGPLMHANAMAKCEAHVSDAVAKGARLGCGGCRLNDKGPTFFAPTALLDVTPEMTIHLEETFGPVLPVSRYTDLRETIRDANNTPYGLAAYVYGRDMATLWQVGEHLQYGMVAMNTPSFTGPPAPFGGFKQSGLGREGSRYGIDEYTEMKYMCLGALSADALSLGTLSINGDT